MAPAAHKRRKFEHVSSDEDDEASFASFDSSPDLPEVIEVEDALESEESDESEEEDSEANENDSEEQGKREEAPHVQSNGGHAKSPKKNAARNSAGDLAAYTAGTFKSNVFKLQVDQLLEQIQPMRRKSEESAETALHELKAVIEKIPEHGPQSVEDAERRLLKRKVAIPFPNPRPPKDAKYKFSYNPPASINVIGSHAVKTSPRTRSGADLDMIVTMPTSMFQEKDYLNFRYFYRRSHYLACIAAGIKDAMDDKFEIRYEDWQDNSLKPILVIRPLRSSGDTPEKTQGMDWKINIIPCLSVSVFSHSKIEPSKNCIRSAGDGDQQSDSTEDKTEGTPFYNSSMRADMLMTSYLKLIHTTSKSCSAFRDACLLGSTWLRQRSLGSRMSAGGFGSFEWSALLAILLQGGGPAGKPVLSERYSSYQLLKATLQLLAVKNLAQAPLIVGSESSKIASLGYGSPMVWDLDRAHNILYKMSPWSYQSLRQEARATVSMLSDSNFDAFDATFILKNDNPLLRFDHTVNLQMAGSGSSQADDHGFSPNPLRPIYDNLRKGLGDRIKWLTIIRPASNAWDLGSLRPNTHIAALQICFAVHPENISRTVDHGPEAENKGDATSFRQFWGDKAELRRFRDGSIRESLVWAPGDMGVSVFEQIVRFVLGRHHEKQILKDTIEVTGNSTRNLLPDSDSIATYKPLIDAYKQLENDIRSIDSLPLSVRSIVASDAQLRYSSIAPPSAKRRAIPAEVVVQFEGSGRWPDDLVAIQRTKIAFLINLSESLQSSVDSLTIRMGLENGAHDSLNQGFLDVIYESGAAFRLRIHHEREEFLFQRQLRDKTLDGRAREVAALGFAKYKHDYVKGPAHTQAIARLCSIHPALSGAIRLTKKWIASHLLQNHIADELVELLVASGFVQPWPWQTPSSVQTGFLTTLFWISRWDWRADPLIVDLSASGELKQNAFQAIQTNFEAWRKLDPNLNRIALFAASNIDQDGTTWTDGRPTRVVATRLTSLARAAVSEINNKGTAIHLSSLFTSPLSDFDFIINLDPSIAGYKKRTIKSKANGTTFKNLEIDTPVDDSSLIGFDPARDFLQDVTTAYGSAILFFSGGHERPIIAGLWHPQTAPRPWRLNIGYSTVPMKAGDNKDEVMAEINREAIFGEIARIGGDLIDKIETIR